jgi:hypothetical protein
MKSTVMRIVKAAAALAAIAGVQITPEHQEAIIQGFMAIYAVSSLIQHKLSDK